MIAGTPHAWKPTILTELGRIKYDDNLLEVADHICVLKPSTSRKAVAIIRNWRLDKRKPADPIQLAEMICKVINQYHAVHSDMTFDQLKWALMIVRESVDDSDGDLSQNSDGGEPHDHDDIAAVRNTRTGRRTAAPKAGA